MARRKFRHTSSTKSAEDRPYSEYLSDQRHPVTTKTNLLRLIRGGEDSYLELKVRLSNPETIAREIVALANTAGGTMVFGVTDQLRVEGVSDPEAVQNELARICTEDVVPPLKPYLDTVAFDNGKRIVALNIVAKNRPYRTRDGRIFVRIGADKREATANEISELLESSRPLSYENIPVYGAGEADFDDELLWSFAKGFEGDSILRQNYDTANFLRRDLLLAVGASKNFLPTVAGLLLFGANDRVESYLPQSQVIATRYSGTDASDEIIEQTRFSGNLLTQFEALVEFVERYCDLWKHKSKKTSSFDEESDISRGNYHLYAVKESLANLLIHRDLALRDIDTQISIFDNRIEFSNPRRTNGFVPPASKAIKYGISIPVNPHIRSIFRRREYGLSLPQGGLPMIIKQSKLFSGKGAEIQTMGDRFVLRIFCS